GAPQPRLLPRLVRPRDGAARARGRRRRDRRLHRDPPDQSPLHRGLQQPWPRAAADGRPRGRGRGPERGAPPLPARLAAAHDDPGQPEHGAAGARPPGAVTASRPRGRALVAVLALALAVRVLNLWLVSRLPVAEYQFHWAESDMAASWAWSGRIISGDILGRDTPHQYTSWMRELAPLETWERWWGGRTVFHQAPLYAYALAAMRLVAGDGFWGIGLCQAVLGVTNVALVYLLAARLFGGAALYGPFLLHETLVLRDTLGVTVSLLLLWWLAGCDDARALPWLVAGGFFALALLAREATLVFVPFVALWIARRFGRHPRALATVAFAFAAGVSLGLVPLVARNLVVGAPPFSLSTRGVEAFVYGNAADSAMIGVTLPAATRSILEQA